MKRFHQLTPLQREKAIDHALNELKSCISMGLIKFKGIPSPDTLKRHARGAAEDAYYGDLGDMVIDGITEVEDEQERKVN